MTYCLIDNCSLINLLSKEGGLKDINTLIYWQKQDALKILLPETVRKEWGEHKEKQGEKLKQSLNTKVRHTNEVLKNTDLNLPSYYFENEFSRIERKIDAIDELLEYSSEISITSYVKSLVPDRQILNNGVRRAPFHNKVDSVKDAYIIFSTLEYLKEKRIDKLLFISENKNDFGDPKNKDRGIHPDIADDYPLIQIDYYSDVFYALNNYKNEMPIQQKELSLDSVGEGEIFNEENKDVIYIDRSIQPLSQLYNYLKIRFKEIKVLPAYLFIKNYPFETSGYSHRSDFALRNINPEILEVFKSFVIEDKKLINNFKSKNAFSKALYILKTFSINNIFYIHGKKREDFRNIRVSYKKEPDSIDKLEQFKFVEVYKEIKNESFNSIERNLKEGYFSYKIGDLISSKDYFLKAKELASKGNQEITLLICNHNLYHLARSIEFRYWKLKNRDVIVNELKGINIGETEVSPHNSKIKDFITRNSFFIDPQIKLQSLTNKIVDTYQSYLRGGRSSNNFEWDIYYQYATLNQFLNKNYVVYEHYADYDDVINNLIESIFASYSIKDGDNKIMSLDDYTILHFILYAKTKDLEKYYKRYYLSKIDYITSEEVDNPVITLFINFISNDVEELREILKKLPEQVDDKFWRDYVSYFKNLLFMHSILKLKPNDVRELSKLLMDYLNKNLDWLSHKSNEVNKYIYHFFIRQQEFISPGIIKRILFLSYKHSDFYSEHLNLELIENSLKDKLSFKVTDLQLINVIIPCIKNRIYSENGELKEHDAVIHVYPLLNVEQKKVMFSFYNEILKKKYNSYLFYVLVIYDVFDINYSNYLKKYISGIDLDSDAELRSKSFFRRPTSKRYNKIDNLLNMWFKYDFSIDDPDIKKFNRVSDYYNWLLNLDEFDYNKFDYTWLTEYGTKFYFTHFRKSKKLKNAIKTILDIDFDIALKKVYCDIYN